MFLSITKKYIRHKQLPILMHAYPVPVLTVLISLFPSFGYVLFPYMQHVKFANGSNHYIFLHSIHLKSYHSKD